jgi:hypothetical protein
MAGEEPAAGWDESLHSLYARCSQPEIEYFNSEEGLSSSVLSVLEFLSRNCGALLETQTVCCL